MVRTQEAAVSPGLRYLFLVHGVFSLIFGLLFCFTPVGYAGLFKPFGSVDLCTVRLLGVFILGIGVTDWFCFASRRWNEVKITVLMEIALTYLATIACLYVLLFIWGPSHVWGCFVIFPAFAVAWTYFYVRHRK
jgi:Na+-driven multidrug efflux pump